MQLKYQCLLKLFQSSPKDHSVLDANLYLNDNQRFSIQTTFSKFQNVLPKWLRLKNNSKKQAKNVLFLNYTTLICIIICN
jgi:hypothetical protein